MAAHNWRLNTEGRKWQNMMEHGLCWKRETGSQEGKDRLAQMRGLSEQMLKLSRMT